MSKYFLYYFAGLERLVKENKVKKEKETSKKNINFLLYVRLSCDHFDSAVQSDGAVCTLITRSQCPKPVWVSKPDVKMRHYTMRHKDLIAQEWKYRESSESWCSVLWLSEFISCSRQRFLSMVLILTGPNCCNYSHYAQSAMWTMRLLLHSSQTIKKNPTHICFKKAVEPHVMPGILFFFSKVNLHC